MRPRSASRQECRLILKRSEPVNTLFAELDKPFRFRTGNLIAAMYDGVSLLIAVSQPRVPERGVVRN